MLLLALALAICPPKNFSTQAGFDLAAFISSPWHIQQQAVTKYLPESQNLCVSAEYKTTKSVWGYEVAVHNLAYDVAAPHAVHDSGSTLCAKVVDGATGKLKVAPCFLPPFTAGEYWVLYSDEELGVALVSGGPPTIESNGACKTGSGTNGSGLWVFTRAQQRDEALVAKARAVATAKGFDLSVLHDVDQRQCPPKKGDVLGLLQV